MKLDAELHAAQSSVSFLQCKRPPPLPRTVLALTRDCSNPVQAHKRAASTRLPCLPGTDGTGRQRHNCLVWPLALHQLRAKTRCIRPEVSHLPRRAQR